MLFLFYYMFHMLFQVCEQCPNVKYEREGYFVTVDIEKGMQDGQVSFLDFKFLSFVINFYYVELYKFTVDTVYFLHYINRAILFLY